MKTKELLYLLGFRPKKETYGMELRKLRLEQDGDIDYFQWLHPKSYGMNFQQSCVNELRRFIPEGSVAIDVGAHFGDSTIPIGLAAGREGCVLAFEPNPNTFEVLEENSKLNREKLSIIPLNCAATEQDGPVEFEYSDPGFCNGGRHQGVSRWVHGHAFTLEVDGRNIEKLIESDFADLMPRISYIKTDAEGYDGYVVRSMKGLISKVRPFVQSEMYKHMPSDQRVDLINLFNELDYHVVMHSSDHVLGLGPEVTTGDVDRWKNYDIFATPREKIGILRQGLAA